MDDIMKHILRFYYQNSRKMLILAKISKLYILAKLQPTHSFLINLFHKGSDSVGFS